MSRRHRVPSYCLHKPSGKAYVRLNGVMVYLDKYNSPKSIERYTQLICEYPTPESRKSFILKPNDGKLTIAELVARYWEWAKTEARYSTEELGVIRSATRPLLALYAHSIAEQFSPLNLKAVREWIIQTGDQRKGRKPAADPTQPNVGHLERSEKHKPVARSYVNRLTTYARRLFKWATANGLLPVSVYQSLECVDGLRYGRCDEVREPQQVMPVPIADVEKTLPHLQPEVQGLVKFQLLTACRPDEATIIRQCDIDRSKAIWEYQPAQHKCKWRKQQRTILINEQAQAVLTPFIAQCENEQDYIFNPQRAVARQNEKRRDSGKFVKRNYTRKANPIGRATERYADDTYRRAVIRACERAGVQQWTPNRLRHTAATLIDQRFGRLQASLVLGHSSPDTTAIYADRNLPLYREVITQFSVPLSG
jgi:integrase